MKPLGIPLIANNQVTKFINLKKLNTDNFNEIYLFNNDYWIEAPSGVLLSNDNIIRLRVVFERDLGCYDNKMNIIKKLTYEVR